MKFYFFQDPYDNVVTEKTSLKLSFQELSELMDERVIAVDKKSVMLFIASDFHTTEGARIAERHVRNPDGSIKEAMPKLGPLGEFRAGRYSDNVETISALVLDYDGGTTMASVVELLTELNLQHVGYTSHSHMKDGKTEKFRVIVPFTDPCPKAEWVLRRHHIEQIFPGVDPRTIDTARAFYMPSCPPELKQHAFKWAQDGLALDWRLLEPKEQREPSKPVNLTTLVDGGHGRVVYETFDMVQFMKDQGLYNRPAGGSKHDVQCPNISHKDGGTVVWQDGTNWPSFHCAHTKCHGFNFFKHYRERLGEGWMKPYCKREPERTVEAVALQLKRKDQVRKEHV